MRGGWYVRLTFALAMAGAPAAAAVSFTCTNNNIPTEINAPYTTTCSVTSGTSVSPYLWTVTGSLPPGVTGSTSLGTDMFTLSGASTVSGLANYTVQVADSTASGAMTATQAFSGTIAQAPAFSCNNLSAPSEVGVPYTSTCTVTGGTGVSPYTWSISAGSLPAGITSSTTATSITISGTPTTVTGAVSYTVQLADSQNVAANNATRTFAGSIAAALTLVCQPNSGPTQVGVPYSSLCTVSGGTSPYIFSIVSALPAGLNVSMNGLNQYIVFGSPATAGAYSYSVSVKDAALATASVTFSGTISAGLTVQCSPATGPTEVGVPYSTACTASNGTSPYTWVAISGLPAGITQSGTTGSSITISGTPTTAGTFSFTPQTSDSGTPASMASASPISGIILAAPSVGCAPANGSAAATGPVEVGDPYLANCTVSGGTSPYTWSISPVGALPAGLALTANGQVATVSGSPTTVVGAYSYQVKVTDSASTPQPATSITFAGNVAAALSVSCTPATGPTAVGVAYTTTCTASGGIAPYTWTTLTLPAGLTQSATTGVSITISGTAASAVNNYSFTPTVTDSATPVVTKSATSISGNILGGLSVSCTFVSGAAATTGPVEVGAAYTANCGVTGGTSPYTWSISPPGALPAGLTLSQSGQSATVSGSPTTQVGAYSYQVKVTDSASTPQTATSVTYAGSIAAALSVGCNPATGPSGIGVPYSTTCTASGGVPPYAWASPVLPAGLTQSGTAGVSITISGTPATAGNYSFPIKVTDGTPGVLATAGPISGTIATGLTISCIPANGSPTTTAGTGVTVGLEVNDPYITNCRVAGGTAPYTWSITAGSLPAGLVQSATGQASAISGAPMAAGAFSYSVTATDNAVDAAGAPAHLSVSLPFSGTIAGALAVTCNPAAGPTGIGVPYSTTCTASNGIPPYTWASLTLPAGLLQSATTGASITISGTPTTQGNYSFTPQATDSASPPVPASASAISGTIATGLTISCAPANNSPATAAGTGVTVGLEVGDPYTTNCRVAGGTAPYTWSVTGGSLPAGLTQSATGQASAISGAPTASGAFSYQVTATDSAVNASGAPAHLSISTPFTGTIAAALTVSCTPATGPTGVMVAYSTTCTASHGRAPYNWTTLSLPTGLNQSATTGASITIVGLPTASGPFSFTPQATDTASPGVTASAALISGNIAAAVSAVCTPSNGSPVSDSTGATVGLEVKNPYFTTCRAVGGTPPYTWTMTGTLVAGFALTPGVGSATVSGSPNAAGPFNYQVTVTDSSVNSSGVAAHLSSPVPFNGTIATTTTVTCTPANGPQEVGQVFSTMCNATNGIPPYTWSNLAMNLGGLLPGIMQSGTSGPAITISWTPSTTGTYQISPQATDSAFPPYPASAAAISGSIAPIPAIYCGPPSASTQVNIPYTLNCNVVGGVGPYRWSVSGDLPPGLTLVASGTNASITGTPTAAGFYQITLIVTDALYTPQATTVGTAAKFFPVTINPPLQLSCNPATSGPAEVGVAYTANCTATGGTPASGSAGTMAYSWNVSGSPPTGYSLAPGPDGTTAAFTVTPLAQGTFDYTITATDQAMPRQSADSGRYSGLVAPAPVVICDSPDGPAQLGVAYLNTCHASSGKSPYIWQIRPGSLPDGLTTTPSGDTTSLTISGTPTKSGIYSYGVTVLDFFNGRSPNPPSFPGRITSVLTLSSVPPAGLVRNGPGVTIQVTVNNATRKTVAGGVSVVVALPNGVTATGTPNLDPLWTCSIGDPQTVNCALATTVPLAGGASYPPISVTVTAGDAICGSATGTVNYNASVQLDGTTEDAASVPLNTSGCLTITKHHQGSFPVPPAGAAPGTVAGTYSIMVGNPSTAISVTGKFSVTDPLSSKLAVDPTMVHGDGWDCTSSTASVVTCVRSDTLAPGQSFPAITVPVSVTATACGLANDPVTVSLAGVPEAVAKDASSISGVGCLQVSAIYRAVPGGTPATTQQAATAKAKANDMPAGSSTLGVYSISASNVGEGSATDPITVSLTLPAGFTAVGFADSTVWSCDLTGPVVCTQTNPLPGGSSVALTVNVTTPVPCGLYPAQVGLTLGAVAQSSAGVASTVPGPACLSLTRTFPASIIPGAPSAYALQAANPGAAVSAGTAVTIQETLPEGSSNIAISGDGWPASCTVSQGSSFTCTRSDGLGAGASYPPLNVAFTASADTCAVITTTATLSVNQAPQSATTDSVPLTNCVLVSKTHSGDFPLGGTGVYTLTATYLGQNPLSGTLAITDTLPLGLTPQPAFTAPDGTPLNVADPLWNCAIGADAQTVTCTRPAVGTFTPVSVTVAVGPNACPQVGSAASVSLNGLTQFSSSSDTTAITGNCPAGQLTVLSGHQPSVFTPNSQGHYVLTVSNTDPANNPTSGQVKIQDVFPAGVTPYQAQGNNWPCSIAAQTVTCTREDSIPPGVLADRILIDVNVDIGACPSATDTITPSVGGKFQTKVTSAVDLQGCLAVSPSSLTFARTVVGQSAAQPVVMTLSDHNPLTITIPPQPAGSDFSVASASCPDPTKPCAITLSQGQSALLGVTYAPYCIGPSSGGISYMTTVPGTSAQTIPLTGGAILNGLSFVRLPDGADLGGISPVAPATSFNVGLVPSPGYCTAAAPNPVTAQAIYDRFVRAADSGPVTYDGAVAPCPAGTTAGTAGGTAGCAGMVQTGTVAGDLFIDAQFSDKNRGIFAYPSGTPTTKVTIPPLVPALTNVAKGTLTASSFVLNVTGYSTPRINTQACFAFAAAAGTVLNTGGLNNCYAQSDIEVWYERNISLKTGSQFTTAVTFSFAGDPAAIGTVDTWIRNDLGDSGHKCMDFKAGTTKDGKCQ